MPNPVAKADNYADLVYLHLCELKPLIDGELILAVPGLWSADQLGVLLGIMQEAGIDISDHRSKHVDELKHVTFDYVITVCDRANENCPTWLGGGTRMHVPFDDPAHAEDGEEQALAVFQRVRDEIRDFITYLPERLAKD